MNKKEIKTILLVEDEVIIALSTSKRIERAGYKILTTNSGEKAVSVCTSSESIDLILMDINLGDGMDGLEAAEKILSFNDIPIVFLSSHLKSEHNDKIERVKHIGYFQKSMNCIELLLFIENFFSSDEKRDEMKQLVFPVISIQESD